MRNVDTKILQEKDKNISIIILFIKIIYYMKHLYKNNKTIIQEQNKLVFR